MMMKWAGVSMIDCSFVIDGVCDVHTRCTSIIFDGMEGELGESVINTDDPR